MIDTLKITEGLQESTAGFSAEQARKLAYAIGEANDDKRLKDLEVKVGVQAIVTGLLFAALVAMLWQLLALRGEVSTIAERMSGLQRTMEQRFDAIDRRLGTIEQKLQRP